MTGLRSYGDPCGIARALDVIGERWALLIVRELLFGPKRFSDIRAKLGASPNVLSQRLGELEVSGVVHKRQSDGLYDLSDWGRELHPILLQLVRWGTKTPHQPTGEMTLDALMAELEATFRGGGEGPLMSLQLRIGEERFSMRVTSERLEIARSSLRGADAVITTDPATLRAIIHGEKGIAAAAMDITGDAAAARSFFKLFARPKRSQEKL